MSDIATTEPSAITAGSTIKWTKNLSDYKPEDGWVLLYSFFKSDANIAVTATDNGDSTHLVNISAVISDGYTAGDYQWQSWATKGADRFDVDYGEIRINANPAGSSVDGRSHVKTVLDAINLTIEKRAAQGNESYSVADVSITKRSTEDLLAMRTKYQAEYQSEQDALKLKKGIGGRGTVRVRI